MDGDDIGALVLFAAVVWFLLPKPWADRKKQARLQREVERSKAGVPGPAERAFLKGCTNCRGFALTLPFRDALGRTYCSAECMNWLAGGGKAFCQRCLEETTDRAAGTLGTHWSIGKTFGPPQNLCAECGSAVREVRFVVLFAPVRQLGAYRVLHTTHAQFLSRRWMYDTSNQDFGPDVNRRM